MAAWRHFSGLMFCGIQGHSWIPSGGQASWRLGEQMQSPLPPSPSLSLPRGNDDHTKGEKRISRQSRSTRPTDNDNGRAKREEGREQSRRRSLVAAAPTPLPPPACPRGHRRFIARNVCRHRLRRPRDWDISTEGTGKQSRYLQQYQCNHCFKFNANDKMGEDERSVAVECTARATQFSVLWEEGGGGMTPASPLPSLKQPGASASSRSLQLPPPTPSPSAPLARSITEQPARNGSERSGVEYIHSSIPPPSGQLSDTPTFPDNPVAFKFKG